MKHKTFLNFFILGLIFSSLALGGCSRTLHERRATDTDPGSTTELKLTGPRVKIEHNF